jgi:Asp-tRNA(Asn)/Glu-tRNA(Gln) amidotransferase A subunit family amidase
VASVPCGLDRGTTGMPVGLQIIGRPRDEESVLALAAEVQRQNPIGRPAVLASL